jgi:protein-disulfide isomerase
MPRPLNYLLVMALFTALAVAQQKPAAAPKTSTPAAAGLPSEETVNGFMQATFGYEPAVSWKIKDIRPSKAKGLAEVTVALTTTQGQREQVFYVTPDGKHAVLGEVIPFGTHPYEPTRKELALRAKGPSRGPADATVTLVEFSDMQCPHCKAAQPVIEKLLSEEPNVKLVFENFPLPNHDWAAKAAAYGDCIGRGSNDAFWKFVQGVYDSQSDITAATADEKLSDLADKAGVKGSEIATCSQLDETIGRVQGSYALGQSLEVNSTPTLFVNGRRVADLGQLPYDVLKKLVEFAAKGGM